MIVDGSGFTARAAWKDTDPAPARRWNQRPHDGGTNVPAL